MANPENAAKAHKKKVKLIIIIAASVLLMAAWIVVFYSMYWNNWTVQSAASEELLDKAGDFTPNHVGGSISVYGHEFAPELDMQLYDVNGITEWAAILRIVTSWEGRKPIDVPPISMTDVKFTFDLDDNTKLRYKDDIGNENMFFEEIAVDSNGHYTVKTDELTPVDSIIDPDFVKLALIAETVDYGRDINITSSGTAYVSFTLNCGSYSGQYDLVVPFEYMPNAHYWE